MEKDQNELNREKKTPGKELLSFLGEIVIIMVVIFVVMHYIVRPIEVIGSSMYPTLEDKEYGISNVIGTKLNHIERFDIVIVYIEEKDEYIVKRVIGMPGETVSYSDGQLYINGEPMDEPFLDEDYVASYNGSFMTDVEPITLGDDEYYCLGDNRPHSTDSRYYGPFKKENIIAKGVLVIYPFDKAGLQTW
jgi:signal peptidase I